jgi:hypothetical protein
VMQILTMFGPAALTYLLSSLEQNKEVKSLIKIDSLLIETELAVLVDKYGREPVENVIKKYLEQLQL